jgi:hypothetical protein
VKSVRVDPDLSFIVTAAVRYSMPRKTYASGLVRDWIERNRAALDSVDLKRLVAEVEREIELEDGGPGRIFCDDVEGWRAWCERMRTALYDPAQAP